MALSEWQEVIGPDNLSAPLEARRSGLFSHLLRTLHIPDINKSNMYGEWYMDCISRMLPSTGAPCLTRHVPSKHLKTPPLFSPPNHRSPPESAAHDAPSSESEFLLESAQKLSPKR